MKTLVVLTFDVPQPEDTVALLRAIDPPNLPFFSGDVRVTVEPWASRVEEFLDGEEPDPPLST